MDLSKDQRLWLIGAEPGTDELDEAPDWLVFECYKLGVIRPGGAPGRWRLSAIGRKAVDALLAET
ncbi:protein of unknown function (plasmid) [Magnetospirillum sp. XM-1]|uniref:hypothetical protein n=1 Tax=unclassified Magnetospirillum TaxID=2617991 RepID=UPI00073E0EB2|nr:MULTISPECIES: hypothetical protein [unclassified Magnetospirillum]ARJ66133.1 hypothetical protein WV31_10885 [Magnetospirillum sp. ME-1]CUW41880.1 protein of unknown function [Magnetospirillum sp. XM-1]